MLGVFWQKQQVLLRLGLVPTDRSQQEQELIVIPRRCPAGVRIVLHSRTDMDRGEKKKEMIKPPTHHLRVPSSIWHHARCREKRVCGRTRCREEEEEEDEGGIFISF